jgi:predicted amidophosphoribosyltransferase
MTWADQLRGSAGAALEFVFPSACPLCGAENGGATRSPIAFCTACREKLVHRPLVLCLGCGAPLGPFLRPSTQCAHCHRDNFAFTRVWSLGAFDGELRLAVLKAKTRSGELLATALADLLVDIHRDELSSEPPDIVIAVPHHWTDRVMTSHQASQTAARQIAKRLGCGLDQRTISKRLRSAKQATLNATARRANLAGVFGVRGRTRLSGQRVLLIDDVLTTGTTAHRVASLLVREAGAKDVRVCVLARGVGHS